MDREIWNEEQWEIFLREHDRRIDRYMSLLFRFMADNPPPQGEGRTLRRAWEKDLRQYLSANGIRPDDVVPRMLSGRWCDDVDDAAFSEAERSLLNVDDVDHRQVRRLPVYRDAQSLALHVLRWSNDLPGDVKDSTLVQFCSCVTQIPANIAKGDGIGYEIEMIGGNIACAKRALASANAALDLLRELKSASYVEPTFYRSVYETLFELRNAIGLYVQELRHRFNLGVD